MNPCLYLLSSSSQDSAITFRTFLSRAFCWYCARTQALRRPRLVFFPVSEPQHQRFRSPFTAKRSAASIPERPASNTRGGFYAESNSLTGIPCLTTTTPPITYIFRLRCSIRAHLAIAIIQPSGPAVGPNARHRDSSLFGAIIHPVDPIVGPQFLHENYRQFYSFINT